MLSPLPLRSADRACRVFSRLLLPGLCCALVALSHTGRAAEPAPAPRLAGARVVPSAAVELDKALIAEVKTNTELMKNLEYLSDVIGPRLTGSRGLQRANEWAAKKMKAYGLKNVRQEAWEVPIGWERGPATMKVIEPDTGRSLLIASAGWSPGTRGKVTGDVVIMNARTKDDLLKYKGKLKGAVILSRAPAVVAPITDPSYGSIGAPPKKGGTNPKGGGQPPRRPTGGFPSPAFRAEMTEFLKAEGAACLVTDSAKPHGLLVTTGGWPRGDRGTGIPDGPARVFMAHEHYAMLYRLASRPEPAKTRVEMEITNTFIPGPIEVSNTIGEVRGSEKPDEIVVVGAHLDSWDLATGTTDNGTGSCVVLETARAVAALAKQGKGPKRTIRFCLFTGEEQGLWGSRKYVERHKEELGKHSVALVHDTGTGKVLGFGLQGRAAVKEILEPELVTLAAFEGWRGLDLGRQGGTDHLPFEGVGVPGFACRQDVDEYRLTHHTQTDTFDHAKAANLIQGAQVLAVTSVRIANMPDLLPRK